MHRHTAERVMIWRHESLQPGLQDGCLSPLLALTCPRVQVARLYVQILRCSDNMGLDGFYRDKNFKQEEQGKT